MEPTVLDFWDDTKRIHAIGTLAASGNYATGGIALDLLTALAADVPGIASQPVDVEIKGIAGYIYEYDFANKKVLIRSAAAVAAHTHDLLFIGGITATEPVAIDGGDTLGKNAATNRTIVGADSATKGGVVAGGAVTAAAAAELAAAALPAGVTGDTIRFKAIFKKFS